MKYRRWKQIKNQRKKIAMERIEILLKMMEKRPEFRKRYRELINKIAKKYRIKINF